MFCLGVWYHYSGILAGIVRDIVIRRVVVEDIVVKKSLGGQGRAENCRTISYIHCSAVSVALLSPVVVSCQHVHAVMWIHSGVDLRHYVGTVLL